MSRPEHKAPPEVFYNEEEAKKYSRNSRMLKIQKDLTRRALELLSLDGPSLILDIGCGSGLSGEVLTEEGHDWLGCDISPHMLRVAKHIRDVEGDVVNSDIGEGLPYRPSTFDAIVSISTLQWLSNADFTGANPRQRYLTFFRSLFSVLKPGGRAVLQWYPETPSQIVDINAYATRCGFTGFVIVDYPNSTRAKKYYLWLSAGTPQRAAPKPLGADVTDEAHEEAEFERRRHRFRQRHENFRERKKSKTWIQRKKAIQRAKGKKVAHDSRYTARRRRDAF
eukprot:gnl/Trimastix_PCT/661.p1 GENE.gnl/Trimastix_PCT/661~~gnl/Trimastix_PCT/661.p1  ORF type:complete len:280 (+),score=48.70 gnl/Trimastix_PCT/661:44-883(+)